MEKTGKTSESIAGGSCKKSMVCPRCGGELMEGEMKGGMSHERRAWACTNYPKCTHVEIEKTPQEQALLDALKREGMKKK